MASTRTSRRRNVVRDAAQCLWNRRAVRPCIDWTRRGSWARKDLSSACSCGEVRPPARVGTAQHEPEGAQHRDGDCQHQRSPPAKGVDTCLAVGVGWVRDLSDRDSSGGRARQPERGRGARRRDRRNSRWRWQPNRSRSGLRCGDRDRAGRHRSVRRGRGC
jgi:hypothetical protein